MSNGFYTNIFKRGNWMYVRYINEQGEACSKQVSFKPFIFNPVNDRENFDARGLRGEYLKKTVFDTPDEFDNYVDRYKDAVGFRCYGSRNVVHQYIAENYKGKINYDPTLIRGAIIDLEVESGTFTVKDGAVPQADGCFTKDDIEIHKGPFPEPSESKYPITAATVYDSKTKTFFTLGLEVFTNHLGQRVRLGKYQHDASDEKVGKLKVFYKGFDSEVTLLSFLVSVLSKISANYLSGWNSDTFDVPYMINRMKMIIGDKEVKAISPWEIIRQRTFTGSFGREEVTYEIYGVDLLDYKELVDKHAYVELANKKLNTAAKHFLNEEKLSYEEAKSLTGLYFNNFEKYIKYNIRDVDLIVRMDAKLKFFDLSYSLAYMFHCNAGDTMATVEPWSAMTYEKLHNRGQEPEMRPLYDGDIQFLGGYVEEPKPGKYKWVISIDAQSLYPHNIMQFNLGVETKVDDRTAYAIRMEICEELGKMEQTPFIMRLARAIKNGDLINDFYWENPIVFQTLKKHNVLMAPNCTFYRTDIKSVFAEFCEEIYSNRSKVKKVMLKREQELANVQEEMKKRGLSK
jgi:DNA polymerase elongation subunit (family B)